MIDMPEHDLDDRLDDRLDDDRLDDDRPDPRLDDLLDRQLDLGYFEHGAPGDGQPEPELLIDSLDMAAWASRKLDGAYRCIADIDAWEKREIERVKAAAQRNRARHQQTLDFLGGALGTFVQREKAAKRIPGKTLDLPGGRAQLRNTPPKLDIPDAEKAMAVIKADETLRERFLKVEESIRAGDLKSALELGEVDPEKGGRATYLTVTGEAIDWAVLLPGEENVPSFTPASKAEIEAAKRAAKEAAKGAAGE